MRCYNCKKKYQPITSNRGRCPHCGYVPANWERRWKRNLWIKRGIGWLVFIIFPLLGILTGQILIVGIVFSLLLGGFLVYDAIVAPQATSVKQPLMRWVGLAMGVVFLLAGFGLLVFVFIGEPYMGWGAMRPILSGEALIALGIVAVFGLAGRLILRALNRRLHKQIEAAHPTALVFYIPPFFNAPLTTVILLLLPIEVLFPLAFLIGQGGTPNAGIGLGVPGLMLIPLAFAWGMLRHNSGAVVVDAHRITRYFLISKKTIQVSEITDLELRALGLPAAACLKAGGKRLCFPRSVNGYPQLLKLVRGLTHLSPTSSKRKSSVREKKPINLPYVMGIPKWRISLEKVSLVVLILLVIGLALIGFLILLVQGEVLPLTWEKALIMGIPFVFIGLIFLPLVFLAGKNILGKESVVKLVFKEDEIHLVHAGGQEQVYSRASLQKVWLAPVTSRVRSSYGGVVVWGSLQQYELRLAFSGGKIVTLKHSRLALFGLSPEEALGVLQELYDLPEIT